MIGAVLFAAVLLRLPETAPASSSDIMAGYRRALSLPRTVPLAFFSAGAFGAYFALISGSPFALVAQMHLPRDLYAFTFGLNALAGLCGSLATGRLAGRIGAERVFAFGVALLACAGAAAWLADVLIQVPSRSSRRSRPSHSRLVLSHQAHSQLPLTMRELMPASPRAYSGPPKCWAARLAAPPSACCRFCPLPPAEQWAACSRVPLPRHTSGLACA